RVGRASEERTRSGDVSEGAGAEETIRRMCRERAERIGRREFDAMVDGFYADDARLLPSGEKTVRGIDAIRGFWRQAPADGLVSLTLETHDVEASGDLGYEIGRFSRTVRRRHGGPFAVHGKYIVIFRRREDGAYRAVAEMYNSDARG
ncbi:MAG: YybH family protein, partial [Gemmatimonadota bacterium]